MRSWRDEQRPWLKKHTAGLNGGTVSFRSCYRPGTFGLHSDAVQACKEAGLYRKAEDWGRILIDGEPHDDGL